MRIKATILIAILASASLLASCANHLELGLDAYSRGEYDTAAGHLAKSGDPSAQYHMGLLWEGGLGIRPQDSAAAARWYLRSAKQGYAPAMARLANIQMAAGYEDQALSWYELAARWGNEEAIAALTNLNRSVPPPDLLLEQQQFEDAVVSRPRGTPPGGTLRNVCFSDSSCDVGFSCVKGGDGSTGRCKRPVADYGSRVFGTASVDSIDNLKPSTDVGDACQLSTDCPTGFRCDSTYHVCFKR